jgi:NAD(P)-dependent dehydrogenase (short-subunit alcohol dehydrogenase family)
VSATGTTRRVVLVTGGGRGLGRACAIDLAERGYDVAVVDLVEPTETADAVRAAGARALAVRCDVAVPRDVTAAVRAVHAELGRCDVQVNNVAIYPRVPFAEVPGMTERGFGRIINFTSNTIGLPVESMTHYITSKAAIVGFTRALASDLGPAGITVNCVAPGANATEGMLAGADTPDARELRMQLFAGMVDRQAIKRLAVPADVAAAVAWLASDEAGFKSAQTVVVDGGLVRL